MGSQLNNPEIMNEMNAYVKSCVVGDILINHKYSINDLLHAPDVWALMSGNPSPIRGIFIDGKFNTCVEATRDLNGKINNYIGSVAPGILSKFIPSHHVYSNAAISDL